MNRATRLGLAALCAAGVLVLLWLGVRPEEAPTLRGGFDRQSAADMLRGLAVISAAAGLVLIAVGVLRD